MQAVHRDTQRLPAFGKVVGGHDAGQFRAPVGGEHLVLARALQVVEVDVPHAVHARADVDHARWRAGGQRRFQQPGEQERRQVIDRKLQLEAVSRHLALIHHHARIVDQHVDHRMGGQKLGRQAPYIGQRGQIGLPKLHRGIAGGNADFLLGRGTASAVPAHHQHRGARRRQSLRGGLADA